MRTLLAEKNHVSEQFDELEANVICTREIVLAASDHLPRVVLRVDEDGLATIGLFDLSFKPRASLLVSPSGNPHLSFYDQDGNTRLDASLSRGSPLVVFRDSNETERLSLMLAGDGIPFVQAHDANGTPITPDEANNV